MGQAIKLYCIQVFYHATSEVDSVPLLEVIVARSLYYFYVFVVVRLLMCREVLMWQLQRCYP